MVGRNRGDGLRPGDREQGIGRRHRAGLGNPVAVCVIEDRGAGDVVGGADHGRPAYGDQAEQGRGQGTFDAAWTWSDYARQGVRAVAFVAVQPTWSCLGKSHGPGGILFEICIELDQARTWRLKLDQTARKPQAFGRSFTTFVLAGPLAGLLS